MNRWDSIETKEILGRSMKMYRDLFTATSTFVSIYKNIDLDHQAYKYFESELFAYRVLDINFVRYMEERGDLSRISDIKIASDEAQVTVL